MGDERNPRLALLRFSGEVGTKARATRAQFRRRLVQNLRDALTSSGLPPRIEVSHQRILVELPEYTPGIETTGTLEGHPLTRIFGVQSVSPVERWPVTELSEIVRVGQALFHQSVAGRRFAVRARRVGERDRIHTSAQDVERELGTALLAGAAGVDLERPEVTARLELSEKYTCFFAEHLPSPGGLPLGVEGNAVALVSGGFDSAVAAWQLLKRGVELDYVFCNLGGPTQLQGVVRVLKILAERWSYGTQPRLHAIDFEPLVEALRERTQKRYWQVILKRLMLRAAEDVARRRGAAAIVTGDAVGQVSSQTLKNMAVISRATQQTILRPLVGANKEEIIELARRIGTFELSKVVGEYCALVPSKPATAANLEIVEAEEAKLDLSAVARAVAERSIFDLRALDLASLDLTSLDVERVPEGAMLIDLRPIEQYRSAHHPDALHLDFGKAMRVHNRFERDATYVLSCEFGLLSAHLAELMRRAGFRAHRLRGGQRALMRDAKN